MLKKEILTIRSGGFMTNLDFAALIQGVNVGIKTRQRYWLPIDPYLNPSRAGRVEEVIIVGPGENGLVGFRYKVANKSAIRYSDSIIITDKVRNDFEPDELRLVIQQAIHRHLPGLGSRNWICVDEFLGICNLDCYKYTDSKGKEKPLKEAFRGQTPVIYVKRVS